jgi:hypothetical protein
MYISNNKKDILTKRVIRLTEGEKVKLEYLCKTYNNAN